MHQPTRVKVPVQFPNCIDETAMDMFSQDDMFQLQSVLENDANPVSEIDVTSKNEEISDSNDSNRECHRPAQDSPKVKKSKFNEDWSSAEVEQEEISNEPEWCTTRKTYDSSRRKFARCVSIGVNAKFAPNLSIVRCCVCGCSYVCVCLFVCYEYWTCSG